MREIPMTLSCKIVCLSVTCSIHFHYILLPALSSKIPIGIIS